MLHNPPIRGKLHVMTIIMNQKHCKLEYPIEILVKESILRDGFSLGSRIYEN